MSLLRIYLLLGLVAHKTLWEILRRRRNLAAQQGEQSAPRRALIKTAKAVILGFLVAQVLLPDLFPISSDPLALRVIGIPLYTLGLALAMAARLQLGDNWLDIEDAQVQPHQTLVASGVYKYVRHPIYTGDLLMLLGFELSLNSWLVLGVACLIPVVVQRARLEESMLSQALRGYEAYCARTWRFVPFVV